MPMKVSEIIRLLEEDGWQHVRTRGSHRIFWHPTKPGTVTVPGKPSKELPIGTERSILNQAGVNRRSS
jgi:predicted RNA binding protein YcfA (HicA-like mRNA interferase family)